ncbi:MAG: hypothetical protein ABSH30_15160 [Acidimicrobiales bacterium]|jgi:hypothetical protein
MSEQPNGDQDAATEEHAERDETSSRLYGRRALMLGAAAAGAGAAVSLLVGAEPAAAADGSAVLLGESNAASATTTITTKTGNGLKGQTSAKGGSGLYGNDTSKGGGYGLYGSSENGTGVRGNVTAEFGTAVYGTSAGEYGIGVYGAAGEYAMGVYGSAGEHGYGVFGVANSGNGVYGTCAAESGNGVYGNATGEYGKGVYGNATGEGGYGVYGNSTAEYGYGVYGASTGYSASGVYGASTGELADGVYGTSTGEDGNGVYGASTGEGGVGVWGQAAGTGPYSYGVFAFSENSDSLFVDGSAKVTGTLSKGGGSFKIDHPLDPAGKYLYHSFVESPDMMNVYNGTVTLDGKGHATVELADWFEALNRDYRYQLTPIGSPAPELHISKEVKGGAFSIAGGKADQKVSWQVTGIRRDAWANAHRIPVEVDKPAEDRGRYLHPELFAGELITSLARTRQRARNRHATQA